MEGTGRFWRLHWPKLRVKDYRLFLRAIQINDRAKGFNPLTDSPQAQSSPSLTPFSLELSNGVRPFGSRCWGSPSLVPLPARPSRGGDGTLSGARGLGGETTALEPQAAIPAPRTDVVAEDAGRLKPRVLRIERHVGVCG